MATFTGSNGQRIKNIGHKNLWFHTKDAPLVVRFGKTGDGQWGPFAGFEVQGDTSGEFMYKPGKDAPDTSFWPRMESQIKETGGEWVAVTAGFDGDYPSLTIEDEAGGPILPKAIPVAAAVKALDLEPVNDAARKLVQQPTQTQATGTPLQVDQDLFLRCAVLAGTVVDSFQEHLGRPMTDADQKIATTMFIEARRGR